MNGIRTSADGTIVSYNPDIGGLQSTRHRKFLRKLVDLPNHDDDSAVEIFSNADEVVMMVGQDNERDHMHGQRPLPRSARIYFGAGRGRR